MTRPVEIYKYGKEEGKTNFSKVADGTGVFHQFSMDYEEFETGTGCFATAIVERPDGTVSNVPVELIVFKD